MTDVIIVDDTEYIGYEQGDPEYQRVYANTLADYIKILPRHYDKIKLYWETACVLKGTKDCHRGTIIKIIKPDIFILKNKYHMRIWSVNIRDYDIYLKDYEKIQQDDRRKENLWKLYNAGLVTIHAGAGAGAEAEAE